MHRLFRVGRSAQLLLIALIILFVLLNKQFLLVSVPYLSYSSTRVLKLPDASPLWLQKRMAISEAIWQRSVDLRNEIFSNQRDNSGTFFHIDPKHTLFSMWDLFPATWNCPHDFQRIGRLGDGGKWVCGMSLYESIPMSNFEKPDDGLIIYSFGINRESSFEAEMLQRIPSARLWGYDFSVDGWGVQIPFSQRHRTFFEKFGLGKKDNHTNLPPYWTLPSLMAANNHTYIDIIKMDIEGSEFGALEAMMDAFENTDSAAGKGVLPVGQILVELHFGETWIKLGGSDPGIAFRAFRKWWERLERMGMRPAWMELNMLAPRNNIGDPCCIEYVWLNTIDKHSVLWR